MITRRTLGPLLAMMIGGCSLPPNQTTSDDAGADTFVSKEGTIRVLLTGNVAGNLEPCG